MDEVDTGRGSHGDGPTAATSALARFADPVVAVNDGTITYANDTALETLELPREPPLSADELPEWPRLSEAISETAAGRARTVDLGVGPFDARVHRDTDGATIVFIADETTDQPVTTSDRLLKDRAINEAPVGITLSDPDREDNPLVYVNDAYEAMTGYDASDVIGRNCRLLQGPDSDEDAIREMATAIDEDHPVTVEIKNYRKDGTEFWNEVTIAPVRNDAGEVTNYVGFQNDVTKRKEAELALERRTEELEYVLDRVEGLIQDVTAAVAGSTDRAALEQSVATRIASEDAYDRAWLGERNPATSAIAVRATGGTDTVEPASDHPATEAIQTGTTTIDRRAGHAIAAFPLIYNEIEYGVLAVRTSEDRAIEDREAVILSALARAIASGINARETSRVLETDAIVAVTVETGDESVTPNVISTSLPCTLTYRRSVHRSNAANALLFTVTGTGVTANAIESLLAERTDLDGRVVVDRDGECLVQLSGGDDPVAWLSDRGVRVESITSEDGRTRLELEIPRSADVRSVVEALEERYASTDVVSFQQRDRALKTRQEFAAELEESLTDRQFSALQRAYLGGYFEWPRPTTGEELAETMDVSRPTFHEHLRTAEAKLCRAFFGDEESYSS